MGSLQRQVAFFLMILQPKRKGSAGEGEEGEEEEEEEEDTTVYKYIPPVAKEWVSQGSEFEIDEESLQENRKRVSNK